MSRMLFVTALMFSAVSADDHIHRAVKEFDRATHTTEKIAPRRRFNLEALISQEAIDEANHVHKPE